MTGIEEICQTVISRIKPTDEERSKLVDLAERIIRKIDSLGSDRGLDIKGILVGSSARGTWISGQHDLDIFIMFLPHMDREHLEEKGLEIAKAVSLDAESFEERYAEHPYIHAVFEGYEVDLVPAFSVASASQIKSAVDRTPFHNSYVTFRIKGIEDEILLLKQFMKGIGVYGSELKTHGFSGYLVELLVIHYGSFVKTLVAACSWKKGEVIDIEVHGTVVHDDPMTMIDPTDPARNVAAALSIDNMCVFIDRACGFMENPSESYFIPAVPDVLDDSDFKTIINERGTSLVGIVFNTPDVVEDVLYPQMHKLEDSVCSMLERYDFRVYNSGVWAGDKAVVLLELESSRLPAVRKHDGPFVSNTSHAKKFKSKYDESDTFSNVYIKNGKYMVEIPRKYADAKKLIESELTNCSLGKHVGVSIGQEYSVLENTDMLGLTDDDYRRFLRRFFEK
ncbi:MAG: CCA tRNA nucleotidyltransferase [Candidatus Methanoperedens sp.]|jgi:tRNA nucleotidyltransferase (CCA-adding enzyme)|nr:CCA tRNA nucleotidyltransferase [Candidatus Methanoperedens sp.]PKL53079.1 MAG: CCA tRNA nucleotidyltransferase [Candidatus Methanoperedenaceae archaeon HGW-Methanoperedenaceae-1]